jgi:hypothetical protein
MYLLEADSNCKMLTNPLEADRKIDMALSCSFKLVPIIYLTQN